MSEKVKQIIKKSLLGLFYLAIIVFIVKYFLSLDISSILQIKVNWVLVIVATLIRVCSLLILPLSWKCLLNHFMNDKLSIDKLYMIYAKSWLGRYIPGKVAWIGGKIYFAAKEKIDTNVAVITSFLDSVLQVFSCMIVGIIFLVFTDTTQINQNTVYMLYMMTIVMLIALIPPIFNRVVSVGYKLMKHKPLGKEYWMNGQTLFKSTSLVVVSKLVSGIGTSCIIWALYPQLTFAEFVFSIGVFSVSTAIGMAALFAPAGLGVKESMQLLLLAIIVPKEIGAITVTLVSVQSVFIDIAFYLIAKALLKFESPIKEGRKKDNE